MGTEILEVTSRTRERKGLVAGGQLGMQGNPDVGCYRPELMVSVVGKDKNDNAEEESEGPGEGRLGGSMN